MSEVGPETRSEDAAEPTIFQTRRLVEFSDTDQAGIAHFSRFYVFMENAEHEFLRSIGSSVHVETGGRTLGWPRLEAQCRFFRPVRFEDVLDIELRVARRGEKSVTYAVTFRHEGRLVAQGRIASVCCELVPGQRLRSVPMPEEVAAALIVDPELGVASTADRRSERSPAET